MSPFDPQPSSRPTESIDSFPGTHSGGGVRVIVRDLPPEDVNEEEAEISAKGPDAIVLPAGQSAQDRESFLRWLNHHWGGFIQQRLVGRGDVLEESAKDLRQRVLLVLCAQYEKQEVPRNMRAFLDRVIEHEVCNHKRRWSAPIAHGADVDAEVASALGPESAALRAERWEKLRRYLTHLTKEEAEVLEAKELIGLTFEEIVAALGRPRSTVARQHESAVEKLKELARLSERKVALGARRGPGR